MATAPLIRCAPESSTAYEEAEPAASETKARPRWSKVKPNGVAPADALETGVPARPWLSTAYVSSVCVPFSVTTSWEPCGEKAICAGLLPSSGWVEPASGVTFAPSTTKPVIEPDPPALRT